VIKGSQLKIVIWRFNGISAQSNKRGVFELIFGQYPAGLSLDRWIPSTQNLCDQKCLLLDVSAAY
jgi:hypothetical protein